MRRFSSTQLCRSQSWSQKSVGFHPRCPQTCCGHCTPQWYCDPAPAPPQFLQSCYPKMPPREVLKYLQLLPWAGAQLQQPAADLGLVPKNLPGNPWVFGDMLFIWICLNWYRLKAIIQPMLQPSQKGTCTWAALGLLFFIFFVMVLPGPAALYNKSNVWLQTFSELNKLPQGLKTVTTVTSPWAQAAVLHALIFHLYLKGKDQNQNTQLKIFNSITSEEDAKQNKSHETDVSHVN